jgi:predicted dehydrogenase
MFRGPKAYQQIAASDAVDMVQISTPDWFHPEHLETVVAAGKHVSCEKPVAVDVPGANRVMKIGEKAKGRLSLDVGFQIRSAPPFVEIVRRIHEGAIGPIAHISAHYHATAIKYPERPRMSKNELRLRNFYWDRIISGDVMVDQNIHVIDLCNWVLRSHPLKADGTGGRKVRSDWGNTWDHFAVNFTYPGDVTVSFNSVQFGDILWDVTERFFGAKGVAEAPYSGPLQIISENPWVWKDPEPKAARPRGGFSVTGEFTDNLAHADREKDRAFVESIVSGKYHNQAATGVESALSAILGRTAAYAGRAVTWDELMASQEVYDPHLDLSEFA